MLKVACVLKKCGHPWFRSLCVAVRLPEVAGTVEALVLASLGTDSSVGHFVDVLCGSFLLCCQTYYEHPASKDINTNVLTGRIT